LRYSCTVKQVNKKTSKINIQRKPRKRIENDVIKRKQQQSLENYSKATSLVDADCFTTETSRTFHRALCITMVTVSLLKPVTIMMHCALWKVWQVSAVKQWPLWCTVLCGRFDWFQ